VGTGVGGGFVSDGRLLHGLSHPEMGHIRCPATRRSGLCGPLPFPWRLSGRAGGGPSIIARWGASLSDLPEGHPGAGIIAWYLAQAVVTFQAIMEPARIVLGGGVTATPGLIEKVREEAARAGAGYFVGEGARWWWRRGWAAIRAAGRAGRGAGSLKPQAESRATSVGSITTLGVSSPAMRRSSMETRCSAPSAILVNGGEARHGLLAHGSPS
jgi:hypothetical protein